MKEVIILGCGPTKRQCPVETDIPVWTINNGYKLYEGKVDKLFICDEINNIEFNFEELKQFPAIVAPSTASGLPNIEVYPIDEILEKYQTRFFSNGVCYMIALALYQGYERIYFYGIDMMTFESYVMEKGGVEYWMGMAQGLGVEIVNTTDSATGKTCDGRLYGLWGRDEVIDYSEDLADQVRDMVTHIPNLWDQSAEWEQDEEGNWGRKPQRLIQEEFFKDLARGFAHEYMIQT